MAATEKNAKAIELARERDNVPLGDDYEMMISGMLYSCDAPELVEARFRARRLVHRFNTHFPEDATSESLGHDRMAMLHEMMGKVGPGAWIEPPLSVDYGCNIVLGEKFYANFGLVILDCAPVTIGHRVMLGPSVSIYAATHDVDVQSRRDGIEYAKPVTIDDDCWIGGNVTILPGVTIGKGCTIGAGSIVTNDIPPWSIAVGSPAKVVKKVDPVPDLQVNGINGGSKTARQD